MDLPHSKEGLWCVCHGVLLLYRNCICYLTSLNAGFAVGHGLLWSVAEKPTMNLQFQSVAELPWEGASLESNFRFESKAQGQNLPTTGRMKLTIPWKMTRPWNKLLCNAPFIIILFFRELVTASRMYHEKGNLTAPALFITKNAFSPLFLHSASPLFSSPGAVPFIVLGKSVLANNIMNYYPHIITNILNYYYPHILKVLHFHRILAHSHVGKKVQN